MSFSALHLHEDWLYYNSIISIAIMRTLSTPNPVPAIQFRSPVDCSIGVETAYWLFLITKSTVIPGSLQGKWFKERTILELRQRRKEPSFFPRMLFEGSPTALDTGTNVPLHPDYFSIWQYHWFRPNLYSTPPLYRVTRANMFQTAPQAAMAMPRVGTSYIVPSFHRNTTPVAIAPLPDMMKISRYIHSVQLDCCCSKFWFYTLLYKMN